jgi:sugar lactone lactonase YvrE
MAAEVIVEFDAARSELIDGLAVRGDVAYVGFVDRGEIVAVDLVTSAVTPFGSIDGFIGEIFRGLAFDAQGRLYGSSSRCAYPDAFRWPLTGGLQAMPWAVCNVSPNRLVVNDLALGADGRLFVTTGVGFIDVLDGSGPATEWLADSLLLGNATNCPNAPTDVDVGANGIAVGAGAMYVTNANLATVIRIPIEGDGTAGTPEVIAGPDCELLGGVDGVAIDGETLYVTVKPSDSVLAIDETTGQVSTVYAGAPLAAPNAVAIAPDGTLIVANAVYEIVDLPDNGGLCDTVQAVGDVSRLVRLTLPR